VNDLNWLIWQVIYCDASVSGPVSLQKCEVILYNENNRKIGALQLLAVPRFFLLLFI
jgi:hypothetical protein